MSGDSTTAETLQTHILGIYKDYIESSVQLQRYLLAKINGGQTNTFRSVFESFFLEFTRLYGTTKHLTSTPKVNALKTAINEWLEASYGIISSQKRAEVVLHARKGLELADQWAEQLHAEEIIRKTDL